jgi:hypothetical protein
VGYCLAIGAPALIDSGLLLLTPCSFSFSKARKARSFVERLALMFGLAMTPVFTYWHVRLDLLWTDDVGGTLTCPIYRSRDRAGFGGQ